MLCHRRKLEFTQLELMEALSELFSGREVGMELISVGAMLDDTGLSYEHCPRFQCPTRRGECLLMFSYLFHSDI